MKRTKILAVLAALLLILGLAACGMSKDGKENEGSKETGIASLLAADPKTTDEASELHQKLMQQETAILSENNSLWEKVFMSADKGMAMIEDGGNYGDFLLTTIENSKDQFTDDELKLLKDGAEQIREIEGKLTVLEQKFPDCGKKPSEGDMSVPAENGKPKENSDLMKFPSFEGKDLDGNEVKSSTLFAGNTVTVVNFWFTTCSPCVGELSDLEALNKSLSEKGGEVVGINSFTLDGDKTAISEAKDVLTKKGASYKNIWFESNSEAGKFTSGLYSYPTTYVVDKNGNIVGDPITGAITGKKQSEKLNELIDQAIANSKG
ncbi:MAG: TlpA family protein disulfide reductase [Clostridium sp.]|jgi:thiol-disulfide isomerase/thioredoxin|nr:TlpA family protein disulfide reductase [Clostridium sp.]